MLCKHPVGLIVNTTTFHVKPVWCDKWSCLPCGRRKARAMYRRTVDVPYRYLLTITAPGGTTGEPVESWSTGGHTESSGVVEERAGLRGSALSTFRRPTRSEVMSFNRGWKGFLQWLRRNYVVGEYFWVNETGPRTAHLHKHILMTIGWFSYAEARQALCRVSGLGAVCDFKRLRYWPKGKRKRAPAVAYCVKYLSKANSGLPRYSRRMQCSTPVTPWKRDSTEPWKFWHLTGCYAERTIARFFFRGDHFSSADLFPELALIQKGKLRQTFPIFDGGTDVQERGP
jgi:hypothetical protein